MDHPVFSDQNKCRISDINDNTLKNLLLDLRNRENYDITYYRKSTEDMNTCALQMNDFRFIMEGSGGMLQLDRTLYYSFLGFLANSIDLADQKQKSENEAIKDQAKAMAEAEAKSKYESQKGRR